MFLEHHNKQICVEVDDNKFPEFFLSIHCLLTGCEGRTAKSLKRDARKLKGYFSLNDFHGWARGGQGVGSVK